MKPTPSPANHAELIARLSQELVPVTPLKNATLWRYALIALGLALVFVAVALGLRPDGWALVGSEVFVRKTIFYAVVAIGSLLALIHLSRPEQGELRGLSSRTVLIAGLLYVLAHLLWVEARSASSWGEVGEYLKGELSNWAALECFAVIIGLGTLAMGLLWYGWLRRALPLKPGQQGFDLGLAGGALAAVVFSLHCNQDNVFYSSIYYSLAVLGVALIGRMWVSWQVRRASSGNARA